MSHQGRRAWRSLVQYKCECYRNSHGHGHWNRRGHFGCEDDQRRGNCFQYIHFEWLHCHFDFDFDFWGYIPAASPYFQGYRGDDWGFAYWFGGWACALGCIMRSTWMLFQLSSVFQLRDGMAKTQYVSVNISMWSYITTFFL